MPSAGKYWAINHPIAGPVATRLILTWKSLKGHPVYLWKVGDTGNEAVAASIAAPIPCKSGQPRISRSGAIPHAANQQ